MEGYRLFSVEFSNNDGLCIKVAGGGTRKPTKQEVISFCGDFMKSSGLELVEKNIMTIFSLTRDEADEFYDTTGIESWPVFTLA